jgi:hypothetical protein
MSKYNVLVNILDKICDEAPTTYVKYHTDKTDIEKTNQARAKAFIHLYLKVSFGLLEFDKREYYLTDGTSDGGIDGYYINYENKTIYFIQSKFRTNEKNFENKDIELEEILVMDTSRILDGETSYENGVAYCGKIRQMQKEISKIDDIGRYRYKVILLANLDEKITPSKLKFLSGGLPVEVFNYERCYEKLVFPILSGTYFNASDLNININLSNKNSGVKISYSIHTEFKDCDITVLFVPTVEIAKILYKYKNSILKFNPRSYLEFEGRAVNSSIRDTILNKQTNEFALFNNGITMLSDETLLNEKIGQRDKAQLIVKNPQIINGGQTAYTLSKIYAENKEVDYEKIFENKEVLLKIITFDGDGENADIKKISLIEDISRATNQQTVVTNADRKSNDKIQYNIQQILFEKLGLFYERKRGEFNDGITNNYISLSQVLERTLFYRIIAASNGHITKANEKKIFLKFGDIEDYITDDNKLNRFYFGYLVYKELTKLKPNEDKQYHNRLIYCSVVAFLPAKASEYNSVAESIAKKLVQHWKEFYSYAVANPTNVIYQSKGKVRKTGEVTINLNYDKYFRSENFVNDLKTYFQDK